MTRGFIDGELYRRADIGDAMSGYRDVDPDELFRYRVDDWGGQFERPEPFEPGETYSWREIEGFTWSPSGHRQHEPDTMFLCARVEGSELLEFVEVVEESPFALVPAEDAQAAAEELLGRGLSLQDVARAAGVSENTAARAAAGHGFVRRATVAALEAAAALSDDL
jgi:Bacterial regulatory proteins, lacI family